jgi:hypothetical protein
MHGCGYRETAAEPILHPVVSPRLDLGIQDGRSSGVGVPESDAEQMRLSGKNSLMRHVEGSRVGIPPLNLAPCGRSVFGRNDKGDTARVRPES